MRALLWWLKAFGLQLGVVVFLLSGCSYDRQEHYVSATPAVRLLITQFLDERGQPLANSQDVRISRHVMYADIWVYDVMPGEHLLTCRLFSTQGQIRDVSELSVVVKAQAPLHRFCTFELSPFDSAGYWSLDVLVDNNQVLHRKLNVSH